MRFRDHINILQIELFEIPLELKTMNSKPHIILQPLSGNRISSLNTSFGYNHQLGVNPSAQLSSHYFTYLKAEIQLYVLFQFDIQSLAK